MRDRMAEQIAMAIDLRYVLGYLVSVDIVTCVVDMYAKREKGCVCEKKSRESINWVLLIRCSRTEERQ